MKPNDFGPIYTETDMSRLIVEPWNTYSNLLFLLIVIYFAWKTRLNIKKFPFMVLCLPVLLTGFVGGTIFHATRSHKIWLIMDFMPIFILVIASSLYFWKGIVGSVLKSFVYFVVPIVLIRGGIHFLGLPRQASISIGYSVLAISIILPAVLHSRLADYRGVKLIVSAVLCFIPAVLFRQFDQFFGQSYLPMGSHFLWHLFGAAATFCMFQYVYISEARLKTTEVQKY